LHKVDRKKETIMSIDLTGRTALITGASRGIGEAAARILAGYGANVVLAARSSSDTGRIAAEIGAKALAVTCDVANYADLDAAVKKGGRPFRQPRHPGQQCRRDRPDRPDRGVGS
jgi:NAD(P)-dependent dehydrogenase (short-subunit alcohol dehydrogenase family)